MELLRCCRLHLSLECVVINPSLLRTPVDVEANVTMNSIAAAPAAVQHVQCVDSWVGSTGEVCNVAATALESIFQDRKCVLFRVHFRTIGLGRMSNSSNRNGDDEAQDIAHAASDLPSPLSRQLHCPGKFAMMTRIIII